MAHMTREQKAIRYDQIVREGQDTHSRISRLKATDINGNDPKIQGDIKKLQNRLVTLKTEMDNLFEDYQ